MSRQYDGSKDFGSNDSNYPMPITALNNGFAVRVSKRVAQEWIIHQQTCTYQGTVHWLHIMSTGLGTYEVRRAPSEWRKTQMVKAFIEH